MKQEKGIKHKLNNAGSTIVTVIIVIAFISILGTTLLYLSGMNYYMKMTDQKTKESFYEAETALEEIKAAINEDVVNAAEKAYMDVMVRYATSDGNTRYALYTQRFFEYLEQNWEKRRDNPSDPTNPFTYEQVLQGLVESRFATAVSLEATPDAGMMIYHAPDYYAYIKGIKLDYTDAKGYTTRIDTNYIIQLPDINLGVDTSKTSYVAGDSVERENVALTGYVNYDNWTKK